MEQEVTQQSAQSLDILSKLLAAENIKVIRQKVSTASFDIITRTLRLPIYRNMNQVQELLLALHEVGHALWTTPVYIDNIKKYPKPNFRHYMNIIEDARIERLMKEKFPGARKDFRMGYDYFHETNFFQLEGRDVNSMTLIDRINIEFKLGFRMGVKFSKVEQLIIDEIGTVMSEEQVFDIAVRVYELAAKQKKQKSKDTRSDNPKSKSESKSDDGESDDAGEDNSEENGESNSREQGDDTPADTEDSGEDNSEETSNDNTATPSGDSDSDEESGVTDGIAPESETQDSFDQSIENSAQVTGSAIGNIEFTPMSEFHIFDYKLILEDFAEYYQPGESENYNKFKLGNQKIVNHMVKEFEMRKAADSYKRTTIAKSGSIAVNKLVKYKIADDIFRKYNIEADSTNHGFIMLVDWSGSMTKNLVGTLSQVITLVQFCKRVGIKFEVLAFSDNRGLYRGVTESDTRRPSISESSYKTLTNRNKLQPDEIAMYNDEPLSMLKFFSDDMNARELEMMSNMLFTTRFRLARKGAYKLGSTPLLDALAFMDSYIGKFIEKKQTQKNTVITLTDGAPTSTKFMFPSGYNLMPASRHLFLHNKSTNRFYPLNGKHGNSSLMCEVMRAAITSLKDKYRNVNFVGFFLPNKLGRRLWSELLPYSNKFIDGEVSERINKELKDSFCSEFDSPGYDKFFVVAPMTADTDIDYKDIESDMSASQIAKAFVKSASGVTRGRVLANKFIALIA